MPRSVLIIEDNTELASLLRSHLEDMGVSAQIANDGGRGLDAFNDEDINQHDLLFQCLGRLERTARKAEESGNFACVIGAVQLMNRMMALGADQKGFSGHRHNGYHYRR